MSGYQITGLVFNDLNGNGLQDAGEPGVAGVTVEATLLANGSQADAGAAQTAADGTYEIDFSETVANPTVELKVIVPDNGAFADWHVTAPAGGEWDFTPVAGANPGWNFGIQSNNPKQCFSAWSTWIWDV
jgi:hypothetical protein